MSDDNANSKFFSPSEILLHSSRQDCWVVIHGKVYDVTEFLEDHPGGVDVLLHASASGDATDPFEEVGHSSSAIAMMDGYFIGHVEGYSATSNAAAKTPGAARPERKGNNATDGYTVIDFLQPLAILALAFAAWYYLTFVSKGN